MTASRVAAGLRVCANPAAVVTLTSNHPDPLALATRSFAPWWRTGPPGPFDAVTMHGDVNAARHAELRRTHPAGANDDHVVHQQDPDGPLDVVGSDPHQVAAALVDLARAQLRANLEASGWVLLRASAATRDGRAMLAVGPPGAGKTSIGLLLATARWGLLGTEAVFAHPKRQGLALLPWPVLVRVGLGLLEALGIYELVRHHLTTDPQLQHLQHPAILQALAAGHRSVIVDGIQATVALPAQDLNAWCGFILARTGYAHTVVQPHVDLDHPPAVLTGPCSPTTGDLLAPPASDPTEPQRGPGPAKPGDDPAQATVICGVQELPHRAVRLGADPIGTARMLTALAQGVGL